MTYYELTPAYGQDAKSKAEIIDMWSDGKDFIGDWQLGFQYVNIEDIPKPCTVQLRFDSDRKFAVVKVPAGALATK